VPALNFLMRTFISPGDRVLIQTPVYYPFYKAIENAGGQVCGCPLIYQDGRYTMDFAGIEALLRGGDVRATILCSPHNPVGRVWTRDELTRFGDICLANDILVVADEIHGDLVMKAHTFTPFASLSDAFAQASITCTAPSKTFNLAGLSTSNIIIPDPDRRASYQTMVGSSGLFGTSLFGIVALEAAYAHGEEWLEQALEYIQGNLDTLRAYLAENIPQIVLVPLEGTYLAWLDCRRLELDGQALRRLMIDEARVYLDEGFLFGPEGEGFERINLACPRAILVEALERIKQAVDEAKG
jgi:cystathionine beta-lyase